MTETTEAPYRVVDRENIGWYSTMDGYTSGYNQPALTLQELTDTRGPWRPVQPVTDADEQLLRAAFAATGRKTITTLAAAIELVFFEIRHGAGGLSNAASWDHAKRTMVAGRAGSWESSVLMEIMLYGNGLNLDPREGKRGNDDHVALRRRGPNKRVDVDGRTAMADVIRRWVTDPARFTEVAETLASIVSSYADETAGAGGWKAVADQWLQPGGMAHNDFSTCYRLFYSQSEHFDSGLL